MIRGDDTDCIDMDEAPVRKLKIGVIQKLEEFGSLWARHRRTGIELSLHAAMQIRSVLHSHEVIREERQHLFPATKR